LKLPYCSKSQAPECKNDTVRWSGGPHGYQQRADLIGQYPASQGSGLDFAGASAHFDVLAMAAGTVIEATCDSYDSLGYLVAIQQDVGESILVYAHLEPNSVSHLVERFGHRLRKQRPEPRHPIRRPRHHRFPKRRAIAVDQRPQWGFAPPKPALDAAEFLADISLPPSSVATQTIVQAASPACTPTTSPWRYVASLNSPGM
jgi:hypothetical protein